MSTKMKRTPFKIERLRDKYAKKEQYNKLKLLYKKSYPEIKNFNTSRLWDKLNDEFNQNNPMADEKIKLVINLIPKSVFKLLDLGFGAGEFEKKILQKKRDFKLYGIDLSIESVKRISKIINGSFKIGNVTDLKYPKNSFDCVLALDILEHIQPSEILSTLSGIHKVLRFKSYLILSVPLNENLEKIIKNEQNYSAHVREYTENIIKAELKISKFKILKEKKLYAFKNKFKIKSFILKIFPILKKPNLIIILAEKI